MHRLGKLDLRTRLFARYGHGTSIPYESALFAGGANPEALMENKYTRSAGFVPDDADWSGINRYEPTHFQQGGWLNLRGYSGYFMPDTRDGAELVGYKGRSGVSVNAELDFERLIKIRPKVTRDWLRIDAYLFLDAGIMELSRYEKPDYTRIYPTEMWSDVHVDAGPGLAATIKKFGPFDKAKPLTIRVDFPVFLNRPPYGNPQYAAYPRWRKNAVGPVVRWRSCAGYDIDQLVFRTQPRYIWPMSRKYRFGDKEQLHFVTYATVGWIDVFTRNEYKTIIIDSLQYCIEQKGLNVYAWTIMTNHVHLIISSHVISRRKTYWAAAISVTLRKCCMRL